MDITTLPFNQHNEIRRAESPDFILELRQRNFHGNHLGSIHASAQYALAEATSGDFLISHRGDMPELSGVVRKSRCKYSAPALGVIYSRVKTDIAVLNEAKNKVASKGRALLAIEVELLNSDGQPVSHYEFIWMVAEGNQTS